MVKIYYLTRENNTPFYIGKTKTCINKRCISHKFRLSEDVKIFLIEEVEEDEWKFWESFWIEQFKQWGFILENKNKGGGGCHNLSPLHIQKLKNKVVTKQTKKKMSESRKNHPMYTQQWRENISKAKKGIPNPKLKESRTGKPHPKKSWEVIQYSLTLEYLNIFPSSKEAGRYLNKNPQSIRDAASGIQKTAYGYKWKYKK
jgi:hypothetical protein